MDVAIIKSLMEDDRKSFRAISREIGVSTPTVKARYEWLINIRFVKSIKPESDLSKIGSHNKRQFFSKQNIKYLSEQNKQFNAKIENVRIKALCEFCGGLINGKPKVLEFANFQRFFWCITCKNNYVEKHAGRIRSMLEQYREMKKDSKIPLHWFDENQINSGYRVDIFYICLSLRGIDHENIHTSNNEELVHLDFRNNPIACFPRRKETK